MPVTQVIEAIKSEIAIARLARDREDARFKITSVEIDLTAVAKTDAAGGVHIEVPVLEEVVGGDLEGALNIASTQRVQLTLKPDAAFEEVSGSATLGLAPAIQSVRAALRVAAQPPFAFSLENFRFEGEFVIARSVQGGVKFVFLEADGERRHVATQRVGVEMVVVP